MPPAQLARLRRAGADPPLRDPAHDHGTPFEGYYWRLTEPERHRVVVALCGLSIAAGERWALVAIAVHPGGEVRSAIGPAVTADPAGIGVDAGDAFRATSRRVSAALGPGDTLEVEIAEAREWPRRLLGGSGAAQLVPGLPQYWHPWILGGRARGRLEVGGYAIEFDQATVYAEKNWGTAFPQRWWWGQADAFSGEDVCVAFAGGTIGLGSVGVRPTLLAARLERRLIALAPPLALSAADVGEHGWRIRWRSAHHRILVEGEEADSGVVLPVPAAGRCAVEPRSFQALAGRLRVVIRRGRRVVFRGSSSLAGLERDRG